MKILLVCGYSFLEAKTWQLLLSFYESSFGKSCSRGNILNVFTFTAQWKIKLKTARSVS